MVTKDISCELLMSTIDRQWQVFRLAAQQLSQKSFSSRNVVPNLMDLMQCILHMLCGQRYAAGPAGSLPEAYCQLHGGTSAGNPAWCRRQEQRTAGGGMHPLSTADVPCGITDACGLTQSSNGNCLLAWLAYAIQWCPLCLTIKPGSPHLWVVAWLLKLLQKQHGAAVSRLQKPCVD